MNENRFPGYVQLKGRDAFIPIEKATPEQIRHDAEELSSGARRRGLLGYLQARPHQNAQQGQHDWQKVEG